MKALSPRFRPARADDVEAAVPLIYSSGPEAFEYVFTQGGRTALDFLAFAFVDGRGFFGWRNHEVALLDDEVVGIGAFYSGREYGRLSAQLVLQAARSYPLVRLARVVRHGLQIRSVMPPPSRATHYVAHLGVRSALQGRGIATALLRHEWTIAVQLGRQTCALDVSVRNARAQALYDRLGFQVMREQAFAGPRGVVPDSRRMQMGVSGP